MAKKFPLLPAHPERNCWGCDKYCPSDSMQCGNGSDRTQHPMELFGEDWASWGIDPVAPAAPPARAARVIPIAVAKGPAQAVQPLPAAQPDAAADIPLNYE